MFKTNDMYKDNKKSCPRGPSWRAEVYERKPMVFSLVKRVVSADTGGEQTAKQMVAKSRRDMWLWESKLLAVKGF